MFERTSSATVRPSLAARFPRYVADYLVDKCGGDAIALERHEAQARAALDKNSSNDERVQKALKQSSKQARPGGHHRCVARSRAIDAVRQVLSTRHLRPPGDRQL